MPLTLPAVSRLYAQSDSGHATIQGRITDAAGNVIQRAEVTVRETQTGLVRKLVADSEGHYVASDLPVGNFIVEAAASGFGIARTTDTERQVVLKSFKMPKLGDRARLNLSVEAYNITRSTNKNMSSNSESK